MERSRGSGSPPVPTGPTPDPAPSPGSAAENPEGSRAAGPTLPELATEVGAVDSGSQGESSASWSDCVWEESRFETSVPEPVVLEGVVVAAETVGKAASAFISALRLSQSIEAIMQGTPTATGGGDSGRDK